MLKKNDIFVTGFFQ